MPETIYDAILGSLTLRQCRSSQYSPGAQVMAGQTSGSVDVTEYFGGDVEPSATFESGDVAGVLGVSNIVTAGLHISSGTITIPWQKRASGSTFAGTLSHPTISGTNGLLIPTSFTANQGDDATASLQLWFRSTDGFTNPVADNTDQTLASEAFNAKYTLGPASINGTTVPNVIGATVNPGIQVEAYRANGAQFPTSLYITLRRPTIDLQFQDFDALDDFLSPSHTVMTAAIVYFRKRSGVGFVADGTAQHCKFSFADGIASTETLDASQNQNGTATVRLHGETLTATATSAIT